MRNRVAYMLECMVNEGIDMNAADDRSGENIVFELIKQRMLLESTYTNQYKGY